MKFHKCIYQANKTLLKTIEKWKTGQTESRLELCKKTVKGAGDMS